jgi:Ca2+-binding RTX toxin-like protein
VVLALDGTFDPDGAALGDIYTGFETILGSRGGADHLRGDGGNNSLFGIGGDDKLDGATGHDLLRGGNGIDILLGGAGNDTFAYATLSEIGDTIGDFSSVGAGNNDRFQITASTFGGGLVAGALAGSQFQSRADNVAQDADDRFIFRTTDQTLWFDVDGTGTGAAVMVADLQASATMTSLDIVLV